MKKLNFQSLNEFFNVDGPTFSVDDPNNYEVLSVPDITPWNKGMSGVISLSEETKRKMSISRKGQIPWNKGVPCRKETKELLREATKGPKTKQHRENISKAKKGKSTTIDANKQHYVVTFVDGRVENVFGIVQWCKENGYKDRGLFRFLSGKRKKYKDIKSCVKVQKTETQTTEN
jgi:hypothetical protein